MAKVKIKWNGRAVKRRLERATRAGLERVGAEFVKTAEPLTPVWQGSLKASTRFDPPFKTPRGVLAIKMGSFDQSHAFLVEEGTAKAKAEGQLPKAGPEGKKPPGSPELDWYPQGAKMYGKAFDKEAPELFGYIKAELRQP